jgi:endonuclease YncB( thermonuclease family)
MASGLAAAQPVAVPQAPSTDPCRLAAGGFGEAAEIIDGDTFVLADGRRVRLAGIEGPKAYPAEAGADGAPIADAARRGLDRLIAGRRINLRLDETGVDRHGRVLAQVFLDDGVWVQEALVGAGLATVRPLDDSACLDRLFAREGEARDAARGLWKSAEFGAITANDSSLIERKGLYVVVEGRVVSVGRGNRLDFLNFGHIWRRDFTVMVDASISGRLAERGLPIETLAERWVRVRGVVEESGGPAIRLNHPSEIEVLGND